MVAALGSGIGCAGILIEGVMAVGRVISGTGGVVGVTGAVAIVVAGVVVCATGAGMVEGWGVVVCEGVDCCVVVCAAVVCGEIVCEPDCAAAAFSVGTEASDISTGLFVSASCVEAIGGEDGFVRFAFFAAGKGFV